MHHDSFAIKIICLLIYKCHLPANDIFTKRTRINVRSTRDNSPSLTITRCRVVALREIRVDGPRLYILQVDYARSNLNLFKTYRNETRFPIHTSSFISSRISFIHSLHTLMFNIIWMIFHSFSKPKRLT